MVGVAFYKGLMILISYETDHLFRLLIMIPDYVLEATLSTLGDKV